MLAEHVLDRYQHGIRYFGLLGPRSTAHSSTSVFLLLGQSKHPRPKRLTWAFCLKHDFRIDPLRDSRDNKLKWIGRLQAQGCSELLFLKL
jgi:hypothetical protein